MSLLSPALQMGSRSNSLTRDWIQSPVHFELGVLATGPPEKPQDSEILISTLSFSKRTRVNQWEKDRSFKLMSFLSSPFPFQQLHPTGPFPCPRLPQVPLSMAECFLLNISTMGDSGGHLSWLSLCRWGNQGPKTWRDGPTTTQLLCPEPRRETACSVCHAPASPLLPK